MSIPKGFGTEPQPQKDPSIFSDKEMCLLATIMRGSFYGNRDVHLKFENQNGCQFRLYIYVRGPIK